MGRQGTAEDENDEFQMQESNQQQHPVKCCPRCQKQQSCPKIPQSHNFVPWVGLGGLHFVLSHSLSNQGAEMQKAKGMLPLMGFGSSSDKWFKKKL